MLALLARNRSAAPCPLGQETLPTSPTPAAQSARPEPHLLGQPRPGFRVRPVELADLDRGLLESLDALRRASDVPPERARAALERIQANPWHRVFVAEQGGRVVGTVTVLIEQKLIHDAGKVAHIEDVAVRRDHQARGVGRALMLYALAYAESEGCYKTILDCADHLLGFYEALGFSRAANTMRLDHA